MAEVRIGSDYQIADCQNIAQMIIDPEGKGLQDFWMKAGWEWMSAAILHVLYRVRHESGGRRSACLADVHGFMSLGAEDPENLELGDGGKDDDSFNRSEEHTSELQSLMRISYAVFCLKKKITIP